MTTDRQSFRPPLVEFLRLIRIWNLPTAIVDPFAGYLLAAGPSGVSAGRLCAVMAVSALLYSAGMAANDVFDLKRDRTLHPDRPLPAGMISRRTAGRFAGLLMLLGLAGSAALSLHALLICLGLVLLIFTYNGLLKDKGTIGCLNMGACRFANMWLGVAAASGSIGMDRLWPFPATLGLYVMSVTLLSQQEESGLDKRGFYALVSPILLVLVPLAGFSLAKLDRLPTAWLALVPLTLLAGWVFATAAGAARSLTPSAISSVIRVSVTGIILLDSSILLSQGKQIEGLICALVIVPTLVLIKYTARRPVPAGA